MLNAIVKLFRIEHWTKNGFVLLPLFFSGNLFNARLYMPVFTAFFSFCFVASSVYMLNDLLDIQDDCKHPTKKYRPIASGIVKPKIVWVLIFTFSLVGLFLSYCVSTILFCVIFCYMIINVLYCIKLKHIAILDICIIAFGFILRVISGGVATNIVVSKWLTLITFLLALFIGLAKRKDDVMIYKNGGERTRKSIDGYNIEFINSAMMIMAAVIIVAYMMYTTSPEIIGRLHNENIYLTTFCVIIGLLRYLQITIVEAKSGSPTLILLKDRFIQITLLAWVLTFYFILYT